MTRPTKPRKPRKPKKVRQLNLPAIVAEAEAAGTEMDEAEVPFGEAEAASEFAPSPRRWWHRYWNMVVGMWFVPFAWIFSDAFFRTFDRAMVGGHGLPFWMKHEFLMFALGAVLWFAWLAVCVVKWRKPRPVYLYVLGHELTHATVATLFLGKVKRFHATSNGGYIETNRYNFLIALAPYLWPFYSIPILAAWSLSLFVPALVHYRELFLIGLGFTWMFHLTFTVWMLPKGQTDFHGPGLTFSFTLIYTVNVILLSGALVSLAPSVGWRGYLDQLLKSGVAFYSAVLDAVGAFLMGMGHLFSALVS